MGIEKAVLTFFHSMAEIQRACEYEGEPLTMRELANCLGIELSSKEGEETDEDADRIVEACKKVSRNPELLEALPESERIRALATVLRITSRLTRLGLY